MELYHELRGTGPVLLIIQGGAAGAGHTAGLVDGLVDHFTVLTYDRRGLSRSALAGAPEDDILAAHREDAHRLLATVTDEPAFVLGMSIGAVVGLDLLARHPDQVRTLIAHEPPALDLLPDTERAAAELAHEEIELAFRRGGAAAAAPRLMSMVGLRPAAGGPSTPDSRQLADLEFFLTHDFPAVRRHRLDLAALANHADQLVPAAGTESAGVAARRCAVALAAHAGRPLRHFAGGHGGFTTHPRQNAALVREVLDYRQSAASALRGRR